MKKSIVIFLHTGYWVMYLCIISMIFKLIHEIPGNNFPNKVWVNLFLSSALIPGLLGFYFSYAFLFPRFLNPESALGKNTYVYGCNF